MTGPTASSVELPKRTASAVVHGQLRQAILNGRIPSGAWLRQEELAASLHVSRMPIREALQLLGEEGLVELLPHRGARVVPLSIEELEEIYAARIGLEGLAARHAAGRIGNEDLDALRLALPRLSRLWRGQPGQKSFPRRQIAAPGSQSAVRDRPPNGAAFMFQGRPVYLSFGA